MRAQKYGPYLANYIASVTDLISAVVQLLREDINGLVVEAREALELVKL